MTPKKKEEGQEKSSFHPGDRREGLIARPDQPLPLATIRFSGAMLLQQPEWKKEQWGHHNITAEWTLQAVLASPLHPPNT